MTSLPVFVLFFLLLCLATTFVAAAIRLRAAQDVVRETMRFFTSLTVGILLFCCVVAALEWIFVRPLI